MLVARRRCLDLDVVNSLPLARTEDASPATKSAENFMMTDMFNVCRWIDTARLQETKLGRMIKKRTLT
jgi:hypothetical protein